jgi:hypothetical protein
MVGVDAVQKWKFLILLGLEPRQLGRTVCSRSQYQLHYPSSSQRYFIAEKTVPGTQWTRGWVETQIGMEMVEEQNL